MCEQLALFSRESAGPLGLRYQTDFISEDEETGLIAPFVSYRSPLFNSAPLKANAASLHSAGASITRSRGLSRLTSCQRGSRRFSQESKRSPSRTVRVLCTEYDQGVGIGWHRDKLHFDLIFGLSLASACKFRFRRKASGKWERFTLEAQPRSLYMMSGEARQVWKHSIPAG